MMKWIAIAALLLSGAAHAQPVHVGPLMVQNNLSEIAAAGAAAQLAARNNLGITGGGGSFLPLTGGTVTGLTTFSGAGTGLAVPNNATVGSLNNYTVALGVQNNSTVTPATGGTGNAAGDVLTLNDGCQTHAILAVVAAPSGGVSAYTITNAGSCTVAPANPVSVLSTTGTGTGATFTLKWGPSFPAGLFGGLATGGNGNIFLTNSQSPQPGLYGGENTFVGIAAGGAFTGLSSFDTAFGHNACGIGGNAPSVGNSVSCFGTDAGRDLAGGMTGVDAFGASSLQNQALAITYIDAFGYRAFFNQNLAIGPAEAIAAGPGACAGANSGLAAWRLVCIAPNAGTWLLNAPFEGIIIGPHNVGNNTCTGPTDFILIGTGATAVDCATGTASHFINVAGVWTATGIDTPSTSVTTLAGSLKLGGGALNGWSIGLGVLGSSPVTPAAGGASNAIGDALTLNDGCSTHAVLAVQAVSGGAVTSYNVTRPGSCAVAPPNPVATLSTTGSGSGATFTLAWGPLPSSYFGGLATGNNGNIFLTNSQSPVVGLAGVENTFLGIAAGGAFTGISSFNSAFGHNACGIGGNAPSVGNSTSCFGADAGRDLAGGETGVDAFGATALQNQALAITYIAAFGYRSFFNQNLAIGPAEAVAVGPGSCAGASGGLAAWRLVCITPNAGSWLLNAPFEGVIIGPHNVGNSTCTGPQDFILIGTGNNAVDCATGTASHFINVANIFMTTGIGTPSTSVTQIAGAFQVGTAATTLAGNEFGLAKISASGSAPGAGAGKLALVAGTTGGTCKLIMYAGTSTSPTTIIDNVGSGC